MKLFIDRDFFDNPKPPRFFLCTTGKKIIQELPSYDESLDGKWGSYSEASFSIDRQYVDVLTGEVKVNPTFDKTEGLRKVYIENIGYFVIQDPDTTYGEKDSKTISCFSSEYETSNKYLENFRINTGEIDSKEVIALEAVYGYNYTIDKDNLYKIATGEFDQYESYYIRDYIDNDSYVYEQVSIANADEYASYDGSTVAKTLYIKAYPNVRFYYPTNPALSLLHLVLDKIPGWKIGNVDATLWRKERKFDEDRIAVYDFLMNKVQDTFKCVVEWDTLTNTVNFYEEAEDGITEDNTVQTRWETDVFISRENLASEININYSTDDIKTKLKVSGSDSLDIREVNLGKNYIVNLDYYHTPEWMEPDLFEAYDNYLETVTEYSTQYTQATQSWVGAYNKWNDLMNAVPADGNVVLVGDEFKKLYCVYAPQYEEGADQSTIDSAINTSIAALTEKLKIYRVNEDIKANVTDNILLVLKNTNGDVATIRIYNNGTELEPEYLIKTVIVNATSGIESASNPNFEPTLRQWVTGATTVDNTGYGGLSNLSGFKVSYIGTMGAYFVLAKDEKVKENVEDYGINLLREKQQIYATIFKTQTEAMYSQEKYQCTASDNVPAEPVPEGTRWFDTDSNPPTLYIRTNGSWVPAETDANPADLENYQRYIDNYEKLQTVQSVLLEKEKQATYMRDGFAVLNRSIDIKLYTKRDDGVLVYNGQELESDMHRAAEAHFSPHTVTRQSINQDLPIYYFTTSYDPDNTFAVYLNGKTPYVSYAASQGLYQATRNLITNETDFEKFFTEDQWIRLSPFIREDEFSDSNFLFTGYESEEERLKICQELMESANKELNTLCQPSLEFSMEMANILALPEFKSLVNQFQLGNFVRVHIRDGYVKRARLLEVHLNFNDLSDFSCDFGNLVTTKSEIDKHAELLSQAVSAGKQVATSAGDWQRAVDKSSKLEEEIANGLQNSALEIGRASGQSILWDSSGIWGRKLIDGTTDQYEDEQFRIINNKLVFSNDGFKTSKSVMGKFVVKDDDGNDVTRWGLLAEAMVGGYIEGSEIRGGTLRIGDGSNNYFQVDESGNVSIFKAGKEKYASVDAINEIDSAYRFHIVLSYDKSTVFSDIGQDCSITCKVYDYNTDITEQVIAIGGKFSWTRISTESEKDIEWNENHIKTGANANIITVDIEDVIGNSHFACSVDFDEKQLPSDEINS